MSRVIFYTTNLSRSGPYRTKTFGIKDGAAIHFKKIEDSPEAKPHVDNFIQTYELIKNRGLENRFCSVKPDKAGDGVLFSYVRGVNLEALLLDAIRNNDTSAFNEVLDEYESFVGSIVVQDKSVHNHEYDELIFGKNLFTAFSGSKCVFPGILDLNFDNLLKEPDSLQAIDYEWAFPHCLPYDYILARSLMWFCFRYTSFFKLHSEHVEMCSLSSELVIPKLLLDRTPTVLNQLQAAYDIEVGHFQRHVTGTSLHKKIPFFRKPIPYKEKTLFALDHLDMQTGLISGLNQEVLRLNELSKAKTEALSLLEAKLDATLSRKVRRAASKVYHAGPKHKRPEEK